MKKSFCAYAFAPAVSVLSLAMTVPVRAQNAVMDPVVVTASRAATPLSEVLVSLDVLDRSAIEQTQASSLADLLSRLAGFEFGRNGGPGTTTSFFLRGHNSVNVVVLVDGVRAATDGIGAVSAIDIPLHRIERVEVMRGNASALYGNAANGGVIHIFTRQDAGVSAQVGVGNAGARSANVALATTIGQTGVSLRLGQDRSAQLSSMRVDQRPAANPDKDQTTSNSLALALDHPIDGAHSVKLSVSVDDVNSQYDDDGFGFGQPSDVHELDRQTRANQIVWTAQYHPNWSSELALSHTTQELQDRQNGALKTGSFTYGLAKSQQNGLRWTNEVALGDQTQLVLGLDHSVEDFESDAVLSGYNTTKTNTGYFAGLGTQAQRWNWQANLRHDRLGTHNRRQATKTDDSVNSVLLGTGYELNTHWKILANASTGFRTPSVGERAASSATLKNEQFQSREISTVYQSGPTRAKLTYFESDMKDLIAYNSAFSLVNLKAENSGVEASAETTVGSTDLAIRWTEQNPRNLDTSKALARRAKRLVSVDLRQPVGQHHVGLSVGYQGERRDSDFSNQLLDAYTLVGLNASYKISPQWRLVGRLENVTDTDYQLAHGYSTPGRSAFVTVNYTAR
ncbi:MAG: Vitamin transporter BtuB precursor [Pseudomonadota bacterium]|jgi:vitamin B12 transporter